MKLLESFFFFWKFLISGINRSKKYIPHWIYYWILINCTLSFYERFFANLNKAEHLLHYQSIRGSNHGQYHVFFDASSIFWNFSRPHMYVDKVKLVELFSQSLRQCIQYLPMLPQLNFLVADQPKIRICDVWSSIKFVEEMSSCLVTWQAWYSARILVICIGDC